MSERPDEPNNERQGVPQPNVAEFERDSLSEQEKTAADELELARLVKWSLIPSRLPVLPGFQFDVDHRRCGLISREVVRWWSMDGDRIGFMIGRCDGRRSWASHYLAWMAGAVESAATLGKSPRQTVEWLNTRFCSWTEARPAILSVVIGELSIPDFRLEFVNAGHPCPVFKTNSSVSSYGEQEVGTPLGMMPDSNYETVTRQFAPHDILMFLSDGFIATYRDGQISAAEEIVQTFINTESDQISRVVFDSHKYFEDHDLPSDDITLFSIRRE